MKRVDLIKAIEASGCVLVRHGGKHDWYRNPVTGVSQPVPSHREVKEPLARRIIRMLTEDSKEPRSEDGSSGDAEPGDAADSR
ncbi:MAG: type II toxin-antitoxin system HicA family toxin [Planctomycetes bacterium]|nr:type II toxin-antitoxin system HicA family toxin [Planctomycetota bacterium]